MSKPRKPHRDFPLFAHANGQWAKKFYLRGKHVLKYFGRWEGDPKGQLALQDYLARKDNILAGLDNLSTTAASKDMTVGQVMQRFLESRRLLMLAKELSPATYGDYLRECQAFATVVGTDAVVSEMKPEHFAAYNKHLIEKRKHGRHARKRTIAYVKAMLNWGAGNGFYPYPTYGNDFVAPDTSPDAMRLAKAREGKPDNSRRLVTGDEVEKMVALATPQFKAIILVGVNCGLGPADIGRLRWRHIDMETGELNMARGKTGTDRRSYLWKRTREALRRVATLKHNRLALEREGKEALVFLSRNGGRPMYREQEIIEDGVSVGVKVEQAISITFRKLARKAVVDGVSFYRLRHTFKTLGKKAKDADALNLMMGHKDRTTGGVYDHEEIEFKRIKRVAVKVRNGLWPKPRPEADTQKQPTKPVDDAGATDRAA